jgi:hypothetical protein
VTVRPVQMSMVEGMERPVGPILPSVFTGTNSDLMAAVAPLYLTGSVLDVTYGNGDTAGGWWKRFTPDPFTFHDLALDGVDFRSLPEDDASIDTVCFDPPYISAGGGATSPSADNFRRRFGLDDYRSGVSLSSLVAEGLAECARVARRFVLVKCMEFVSCGRFQDLPTDITLWARSLGMTKQDQIVHHTGSGPGGHNIWDVKRARRHHSYLLVFAPLSPVRTAPKEGISDGRDH